MCWGPQGQRLRPVGAFFPTGEAGPTEGVELALTLPFQAGWLCVARVPLCPGCQLTTQVALFSPTGLLGWWRPCDRQKLCHREFS